MKDFDFVKFTLYLTLLLLVLLVGATFWMRGELETSERELVRMEDWLEEVGERRIQIEQLRNEKEKDQFLPHKDSPYTFFQNCASPLDLNRDFQSLVTGKQEQRAGFVDQTWSTKLKKDREKNRRQIAQFIWKVETSSPRFKLIELQLSLDPDAAEQDLWDADFTFLRRDPGTVGQTKP